MVSSAYLRLLTFLLAILTPVCASSNPVFHTMYSAYKLNKQGDNIQPWCIPFLIWNQSVVPCPVLTIAPWPAYKFLRRQVRWFGIPISWIIFQFVVIHTVDLRLRLRDIKSNGINNKFKRFLKGHWQLLTFHMQSPYNQPGLKSSNHDYTCSKT